MEDKLEYVTVVYRLVDEPAFRKTNPLKYQHDGLMAIGVAAGDLMARCEQLENQDDDLRERE